MNVTKPEKMKISKKTLIIYIAIVLVCLMALLVSFYVQFYKRIDLSKLVGINQAESFGNKSEDEKIELESDFLKLLSNTIDNKEGDYNNKKEKKEDKNEN